MHRAWASFMTLNLYYYVHARNKQVSVWWKHWPWLLFNYQHSKIQMIPIDYPTVAIDNLLQVRLSPTMLNLDINLKQLNVPVSALKGIHIHQSVRSLFYRPLGARACVCMRASVRICEFHTLVSALI